MKNFFIIASVLFFILSGNSYAEDKVGYVDVQAVLSKSRVGQKSTEDLKKLYDAKRAALTKEEDKLKAMQKKIEKDKLLMSKDQLKEKQNEFRAKMQHFQGKVSDYQIEIKKKEKGLTKKMISDIQKIIEEVAKDNNFTFVVDRNEAGIFYAADNLDLTDKVLKKYDAKN